MLFTFDALGRRVYNLGLIGRGKKNDKTSDLLHAANYFFLGVDSPQGNDCIIIANDEDQAANDLSLEKKLILASPMFAAAVDIQQKQIVRRDGKGTLRIVPAGDSIGLHGTTYEFLGIDEMHGWKTYEQLEALAHDPTRDSFTLIASYASLFHRAGYPLFDFFERGKACTDPRMYFSWYSGTYGTDPEFNNLTTAEERANPSMSTWPDASYLAQQKARLPSNRYRRLHINLPLTLDGQYINAEALDLCIASGRKSIAPLEPGGLYGGNARYRAFVDMSGGSQDDAVLSIAYRDPLDNKVRQCVLASQSGGKPFNPRHAIAKFAAILKQYGCLSVSGDQYAGNTFVSDFQEHGIAYCASEFNRSELYEMVEPLINSGMVELLDIDMLREQFLGLVQKGERIDHVAGEHDDWCNATAGAVVMAARGSVSPGDNQTIAGESTLLAGLNHNVAQRRYASAFDYHDEIAAGKIDESAFLT